MARIADWVKESVTGTPGTGAITLGGAVAGHAGFLDLFTNSDYVAYVVEDGNNKEEGYGQLSSGTLIRTAIFQTLVAGVFDNTAPTPISLTSAAIVSIPAMTRTLGVSTAEVSQDHTVDTCSAAIPLDNTLPQITEGTALGAYSITPAFYDSRILIEAQVQGTATAAGVLTAALFLDGTADSIGASFASVGASEAVSLNVQAYYDTNNSGDTLIFEFRCGMNTGTFYVNGDASGGRLLGGASGTCLRVSEVRKDY